MHLEQLECRFRRIRARQKVDVLFRNRTPLDQRLHAQNRVPVFAAVEKNLNLLGELLGLHQRENLEHLVERSEAAGENHECLCQVRKPELAHEEIVKLEVQAVGDVGIRPLLARKADVQPDRLSAAFGCPAIGGLHDPRTAAGRHDEPVMRRVEPARPFGQHAREHARVFVIPRPLDGAAAAREDLRHLATRADAVRFRQLVERLLRGFAAVNTRRSKEHHRVLDVLDLEAALRLEVFGQDADGARVLALEKGVIEIGLRLRTHLPIIDAHLRKCTMRRARVHD